MNTTGLSFLLSHISLIRALFMGRPCDLSHTEAMLRLPSLFLATLLEVARPSQSVSHGLWEDDAAQILAVLRSRPRRLRVCLSRDLGLNEIEELPEEVFSGLTAVTEL